MYVEQAPSGRWRGEFRVPGTRRKVKRTFDYPHEAEAWAKAGEKAAKAAAAAATGHAPVEDTVAVYVPGPLDMAEAPEVIGAPTVSEYGTAWLARHLDLAKSTTDGYRWSINHLSATKFGRTPMNLVRGSDVDTWRSESVKAGVGRPSLNAHLKVLRMLYTDAIAEDVVTNDPTRGRKALKVPQRQDAGASLGLDAVDRLVAAARTPQEAALVLLGADAGLRYQEAAGLAASAVVGDFVIVRQVLERSTGQLRPWTKGEVQRKVPMTSRLKAALAPLVAEAAGPDALLITTETGAPMLYDNFRHRVWPGIKRRAGVRLPKGQGIHQLRHHSGTRLAEAGWARNEIAEFLGHADEATTKRYIHSGIDGRRLAMLRAMEGEAPTLTLVPEAV
jgi:integrase